MVMGRFGLTVLIPLLLLVHVHGNLFSNFLNYITNSPQPDHSDEIARRFKRITRDEDFDDNDHVIPPMLKKHHGEEQFKRSAEEQELEEILHHGDFDKEKNMMTRSSEDVGRERGGSVLVEKSATLKENNNDRAQTQTTMYNSKYPKINSREEKEMSSIKTISSNSVPAKEEEASSGSGDDDSPVLTEVYNWPKGRYGLPKPISGCPTASTTRWKTGFRYHDTEDDGTENQRSDNFHLAANFSEDGISHEFCIKDDFEGEGGWPPGQYCIYKRGPLCPDGLEQGFVIWDDENTDNQDDKGGALPEGEYTEDTKIFFCCSDKGVKDSQISLPAKKPFFLFAYKSVNCQKVLNMKVTSEFIKFDDEDRGNADYEEGAYPYGIHQFQKDHMLFLCYYEPNKPVVSYNAELSYGTNLEEDVGDTDAGMDQESLRQSEEMMQAFMKATGGVEDETNKKERTKTIIKTIKVPVHAKSSPIATVIGLILGSFIIGTAIIVLAKHVNRRPVVQKQGNNNTSFNNGAKAPWPDSENRGKFSAVKCTDDEVDDERTMKDNFSDADNSDTNSYYTDKDTWSDLEVDDELVEDQLLPDSELKSGLELLFLKQQRHYWNQKRRHNQSRDSVDK